MERKLDPLPYLTQDLPGTGGQIRCEKDDFLVEEIPLYLPSGTGTHLYLQIEKRGISTFEAVTRLARALNRKQQEFGIAGLKDADAVTRQYLSIEHVEMSQVESLDVDSIKVLDARYHTNKLKMGHLAANRFRTVVRGIDPDEGPARAQDVLSLLQEKGIPNFFGPQRFGNLGNTHLLGLALVQGNFKAFSDLLVATPRSPQDGIEYEPVIESYKRSDFQAALEAVGRRYKYERRLLSSLSRTGGNYRKAVSAIDKRMLTFYCSAFQSFYFNRYLEKRLHALERIEMGDVAYIHGKGACFLVEDPEKEALRAHSFEISPSGPIFGRKMLRARGQPGILEDEILKETGLALEEIKGRFGIRLNGARRPLRIPLKELSLDTDGDNLIISFTLPTGSYATVLLNEVTKGATS